MQFTPRRLPDWAGHPKDRRGGSSGGPPLAAARVRWRLPRSSCALSPWRPNAKGVGCRQLSNRHLVNRMAHRWSATSGRPSYFLTLPVTGIDCGSGPPSTDSTRAHAGRAAASRRDDLPVGLAVGVFTHELGVDDVGWGRGQCRNAALGTDRRASFVLGSLDHGPSLGFSAAAPDRSPRSGLR